VARDELYRRINERADTMMLQGLEEVARDLYPYRHLNALITVGYKELFSYLKVYTIRRSIGDQAQHAALRSQAAHLVSER
jgi:tRNA dimethylallyltransferase